MILLGRPFRFAVACLMAIGLGADETCMSGSFLAATPQTAHGPKPASKHICGCAMRGVPCHCGTSCCCQKPLPEKSLPVRQNTTNRDFGSAKLLAYAVLAVAGGDNTAGCAFGKSSYALASLAAPLTLQLQHVRLQI